MRFIAWLSVDKDGGSFLFREVPERWETEGVWMGNPVGCIGTIPDDMEEIPEEFRNMTWEDDPARVQIEFDEFTITNPKPIQL